jgi:hypothetical protein
MFSLLHWGKQHAASLSIRNEGVEQIQKRATRFDLGEILDGTIGEKTARPAA